MMLLQAAVAVDLAVGSARSGYLAFPPSGYFFCRGSPMWVNCYYSLSINPLLNCHQYTHTVRYDMRVVNENRNLDTSCVKLSKMLFIATIYTRAGERLSERELRPAEPS